MRACSVSQPAVCSISGVILHVRSNGFSALETLCRGHWKVVGSMMAGVPVKTVIGQTCWVLSILRQTNMMYCILVDVMKWDAYLPTAR